MSPTSAVPGEWDSGAKSRPSLSSKTWARPSTTVVVLYARFCTAFNPSSRISSATSPTEASKPSWLS